MDKQMKVMKRVILSTVLICGLALAATAQTATGSSSGTNGAAGNKKSKTALKPSDTLNNRKIYTFKNGQRSTPTGREATPSSIGGGYAAIGRSKTSPPPPAPSQKQKAKAVAKRSN
jgi:hypothetical protein